MSTTTIEYDVLTVLRSAAPVPVPTRIKALPQQTRLWEE